LQNVIGQVYTDLGDYEKADRLLMKSLTTRREASGDTREVADALFNLGVLRWRQSNFAEAELVFRQAYDIWKEMYGTEVHPDVAGALNALALSISKQGRLAEAVPMQERMMEISPQLEESAQWEAMSINNLAVLYQNLERYGQAVPLAKEMLASQQELYDAPHPQIAMGLTNLGSILTDALRAEEAIPPLREALTMRETIYDSGHPDIASAYHNLAEATYRAGQMEAADSLFRIAIEKSGIALGTNHAGYGDVLHDYGLYLRDTGQRDRARDTLTVALQVRESVAGANLTRVARTLAAIASLDLAEGSAAAARDAESRLRRAASIFAERFAEPHPFSYVIQSRLGRALLRQQQYDAAEAQLRAAYRGLETVTGVPSLDRAATADALAALYATTGQPEYAETWRGKR
jgi:serine/threonine-protein kinase